MSERQIRPSEIQHIHLPHPLHPRQFAATLTESAKKFAFTIYEVQFDEDARQPIGLETKRDLGRGNEGVFILNHRDGDRYLVQFESAYLSINHILSYQGRVRRVSSRPPLLNLSEATQKKQAVLHYQYQDKSASSGAWMQPSSTIEFRGSDEFLQHFVLNLQKPQATNEGEPETPAALSNLLLSALRAIKAGSPKFISLSPEEAEEIQSAGIDIQDAMQTVTKITGLPVIRRKRQQ